MRCLGDWPRLIPTLLRWNSKLTDNRVLSNKNNSLSIFFLMVRAVKIQEEEKSRNRETKRKKGKKEKKGEEKKRKKKRERETVFLA